MRTLEEVEKDLDKVKAEFDILLAEKSKLELDKGEYFKQEMSITFYTKDFVVGAPTISYLKEILHDCEGLAKLDPGWKFPISKEEYEEAINK